MTLSPLPSNPNSLLPPSTDYTSTIGEIIPPKKNVWEGIYAATARSDQKFYYGPLSSLYFIGRIGSFLGRSLQQSYSDHSMQPKGANRCLGNPVNPAENDTAVTRRGEPVRLTMSRTQEEHFLNLFWESHHSNMPVVAEDEFRQLYDSLWEASKPHRKPSALVDIVLAISMQYGWVFLVAKSPSSSIKETQHDDASIAGRWYYRRSQTLLAAELESPSITTLQCQIFAIIYLCVASFRNMAHTTLAMAVRTAEILGLHLEPPESMPRSERELRKRIWAILYNLEAKTCINLGRPFSVHLSDVSVTPPSDDREAASFFNSSLGIYDNEVSWLTYSCQMTKMVKVSVNIYNQLYSKFADILGQGGHQNPYKDPKGLEACAEALNTITEPLRAWVEQVPDGLKLRRRNGGESLSFDRSPIIYDTSVPTWLARQRICLELLYHNIASNFYRPFINFCQNTTPTAQRHAVTGLNHAIAHTFIMHQVLTETDLMNSWQEFFLWQWCATATIIGFLLAYPIHPSTNNARKAAQKAIEVFEGFGSDFAVSASAAILTRELVEKVDLLMERLRSGISAGTSDETSTETVTGVSGNASEQLDAALGIDSGFSEFMDWASAVDSYNNFEDLFADANTGTDWWGMNS